MCQWLMCDILALPQLVLEQFKNWRQINTKAVT